MKDIISENLSFAPPKEWVSTGCTYLIIGPTGHIGTSISGSIAGKDQTFGVSRGNLDISNQPLDILKADATQKDQLVEILRKIKPSIIIDLGGNANLEECQKDPQMAYDQNVGRVKALTDAVSETYLSMRPVIILGSTDYVYGSNEGPYKEEAPRKRTFNVKGEEPVYAQTKIAAEKVLVESSIRHNIPYMILRFAFPYDQNYGQKPGTAVSMFEALAQSKNITALTDLKMTVTPTQYIPRAINTLIRKRVWEDPYPIFNIAGPTAYSGFQIAQICADELRRRGLDIKKDQIKADTVEHFFEGKAPRPINGGLDTSKIQRLGIMIPNFKDDIKTFTLPKDQGGSS